MVFLDTFSLNSIEQHLLRAKSIFLVPITLYIVVIYSLQIIGWVPLSCICIDNVLDGIINKLQYSMLCIKRATNRVPVYEITSILSLK